MSHVTTRLAKNVPEDTAAINRLLGQFRREFGYEDSSGLPAVDGPGGIFNVVLADAGGETVGFLVIQRCHNLARGACFLLLTDIYVTTEGRQQGVAKELMGAVRDLAPRLGCEAMSLMVSEVNIPALTTAARAGFTRHDQLLFSYSESESDEG